MSLAAVLCSMDSLNVVTAMWCRVVVLPSFLLKLMLLLLLHVIPHCSAG